MAAVEIMRKENLSGLSVQAAFRVLCHSYAAVVPVTPLSYPPLPLPCGQGPTNYGPTGEAATPWAQLALWQVGCGVCVCVESLEGDAGDQRPCGGFRG